MAKATAVKSSGQPDCLIASKGTGKRPKAEERNFSISPGNHVNAGRAKAANMKAQAKYQKLGRRMRQHYHRKRNIRVESRSIPSAKRQPGSRHRPDGGGSEATGRFPAFSLSTRFRSRCSLRRRADGGYCGFVAWPYRSDSSTGFSVSQCRIPFCACSRFSAWVKISSARSSSSFSLISWSR